ncbi:MAG: hypothetical protein ABSD03_07430 [Vulcanimicrobiaceae bacterium]
MQTAQTTPTVTTHQVVAQSATGFNVSHYPIIDIIPMYTEEAGQFSKPGTTYDYFDVGGTIKLPVTTKLSFSFDRNIGGTLNTAPTRQLNPTTGATTYNADSRDSVLVYRADWTFSPQWNAEVGEQFRHREYAGCLPPVPSQCPLSATGFSQNSGISSVPFPYSNNSTEAHWGYLGLTYTTQHIPQLFGIQFAFNLTGDWQRVDPHVAELCTAVTTQPAIGTDAEPCLGHLHQIIYVPEDYLQTNHVPPLNQSNYYETTQYIAALVPFTHGLTGSVNYTWGALNFYENQEYPWRWADKMTYVLTQRLNPGTAISLRYTNATEDLIGIPYLGTVHNYGPIVSNAVHVANFDAYFTFHFDSNSLFH